MSNPTPHDKLLSLINSANVKQWEPGQLVFSSPTPIDGDVHNTSVVVTPAEGQPYSGAVTMRYNRVQLGLASNGNNTAFDDGDYATTADLVPLLRERFGVVLTTVDILDEPLPEPNEFGEMSVTITASPDSHLWLGQMLVTLAPGKIQLSQAIANNVLSGLTYEYHHQVMATLDGMIYPIPD